jgi:hypothetical protein
VDPSCRRYSRRLGVPDERSPPGAAPHIGRRAAPQRAWIYAAGG